MNLETQKFISKNLHADVRALALKSVPKEVDLTFALQQIQARQILRTKVPSWAENEQLEFPAHLSIEQCSSEATARYKTTLISGETLVDLTGGLGVDSYFLSQKFRHTDYVEHQENLADLAKRNFDVLDAKIDVHTCEAEDFLAKMPDVSAIFIDPARRDNLGRKVVSIADCSPDVAQMQTLLLQKAPHVLIKLSPMLDISATLRDLQHVKELHVVSANNECKEILVLLERDFSDEITIFAVDVAETFAPFRFTLTEEKNAEIVFADSVKKHLYEPNAALLKAGAFKSVAQRYNLEKLHKNSHLYTSDVCLKDFLGRSFAVETVLPFNKETCRMLQKEIKQANITIRNFPLTVAELRQKLKLSDGGDVYLFATTINDNEKVLIECRKNKKLNKNEYSKNYS